MGMLFFSKGSTMKAVIDIGSNTTQLLLAESKNGKAKIVNQQIRTTRLGAGIAQHLLTPQGIANTVAALDEYRQLITAATVGQIRLIATAAVRDAVNRQELLDIVQERFGWTIEVLSGSEEASLAYAGAVAATGEKKLPVVDIGGGSTEIIMVKDACATTVSAPLGAVRVMMAGWDEQKVMQLVRENFAGITFPAKAAIGVGGTITTAAGLLLGLAA
ncbi:MAG: Ppx/GppA family phosphatase, partial [Clostridiales bacterium]